MKKCTYLILIALFSYFEVLAQDTIKKPSFLSFKNNISISYGIGAYTVLNKMLMGLGDYNPYYKSSSLGAFSIKYERLISPTLGLGFTLNYLEDYSTSEYNDTFQLSVVHVKLKSTRKTYSVLLRANYHYFQTDKIDTYIYRIRFGI